MKDYIKPSLTLLVICFVMVALVATVNSMTAEKVETLARIMKEENMQQVLDEADSYVSEELAYFDQENNTVINEINTGYTGDEVKGYVYVTTTVGYGGDITVMVGLDISGKVTGVVMGDNNETVGLGKKASEAGFLNQFIGADSPNIKAVKSGVSTGAGVDTVSNASTSTNGQNQIDAISGATITSDAMARAVNASLKHFTEERG